MNLNNFKRRYTSFAFVICNFVIFLFVFNAVWAGIFLVRDWQVRRAQKAHYAKRPGMPVLTKKRNGYQMTWVDTRSYEAVDTRIVSEILDDFFDFQKRGIAFEPYVQFSDPSFESKHLNIKSDDQGFRTRLGSKTRGESEKQNKQSQVFVFGGSTTLGWNVSDSQTIPDYLDSLLETANVINFGRTDYSWFQEMVLFQRLIHSGNVPDVALFIDGVNIQNVQGHKQIPHWTRDMASAWQEKQFPSPPELSLPAIVPMFRIANFVHRKISSPEKPVHNLNLEKTLPVETQARLAKRSYLNTQSQIRAIAAAFDVKLLFVWQPNRAFSCESEKYSPSLPAKYTELTAAIYQRVDEPDSESFLNLRSGCSSLAPGRRIFVDDVHYSPYFNRQIASAIAKHMAKYQKIPTSVRSAFH